MNRDEEQRWEETNRESRYQQFKARALSKPAVRKAYEEGLDDLRIAVRLAEPREKRGMTAVAMLAEGSITTARWVIRRSRQWVGWWCCPERC